MRQISNAAMAKLATAQGVEPIIWVQVFWTVNSFITYSDRAFPELGLAGKILDVSPIDEVVNIQTSNRSAACTVKLDDVDGTIKAIFNSTDINGIRVRILQWFAGLPLSDAFVLLDGVLNTPIVWKEGDRTVQFEVINKLEDIEIGFSVEDGSFVNVPEELLGKPWPLVFGTVINFPALMLDRIPSGATKVATGIYDKSLQDQADNIDCQSGKQLQVAQCLSSIGADLQFRGQLGGEGKEIYDKGIQFQQRAQDIRNQVASHMGKDSDRLKRMIQYQQQQFDLPVIPIINGVKFAQNIPVGIRIGKSHYFGIFQGDNFFVISRRGPDVPAADIVPGMSSIGLSVAPTVPGVNPSGFAQTQQNIINQQTFNQQTTATGLTVFETSVGDFVDEAFFGETSDEDFITPTKQDKKDDPCGPQNLQIIQFNPKCTQFGKNLARLSQITQKTIKPSAFVFNQAGSPVKPDENYPIRYIANIVPGTVINGISVYMTVDGIKTLVAIPPNLYTISEAAYGSITATIITFQQPLSSWQDYNWGDDIYLTMTSPVGPNTVDIIKYIINTWGIVQPTRAIPLQWDGITFDAVRILVDPFPSHFVLDKKQNIVAALKEIAYQARCALWVDNNIFYIKYLPLQESPVDVITESDIESKSLEVTTTRSEDLITQYEAKWKVDYAQKDFNRVFLQNNVPKYGLHKKDYDFFIYNDESLVEKGALFWMIRMSNIWKKIKFKTFIHKLKVESLDTVTLNFSHNYVANGPVPGIVEKAAFNSSDLTIEMEIWIPVRLGEMTQFSGALPSDVDLAIFATPDEIAGNIVGAQLPNANAGGDLGGVAPPQRVTTTNKKQPKQPVNDRYTPPAIGTTVFNYAPAGIGTDASRQIAQSVPAPQFVTTFKQYKELPRPQLGFAGGSVPGKVLTYDSTEGDGQVYSVNAFVDGLDKDPVQIKARQLELDAEDELVPGSWVLIARQTYVTLDDNNKPVITFKYYMQDPVWRDDPEE